MVTRRHPTAKNDARPIFQHGTVDRDLKAREKTNTHFPVVDLLKLFVQICEGIKVFHCFRPTPLAHRDIKPTNVLLAADGSPVVMDLGQFYSLTITPYWSTYDTTFLTVSCRFDRSGNRIH
jgi:serine/threonine protein kinase